MTDTADTRATIHQVDSAIETQWLAFLASFDGLDPSAMEESAVTGEWSVKQVIGHVAFCDGLEAVDARGRAAGIVPGDVDWQAENDLHGPRIAALPLDDVVADLHARHAEVLLELRSLATDDARAPGLAAAFRANTIDHYDEHAADIRAWRERTGR